MSLALEVKQQFFLASQNDPGMGNEPVLPVKLETFRQILAPVRDLMKNDPVYAGREVPLSGQLTHLRAICNEAQMKHDSPHREVKQDRNHLLEVFQDISERLEDTEDAGLIEVDLDYRQPGYLVNLVDTMREDAKIHAEYMGTTCVGLAIDQVADCIVAANEAKWEPLIEVDQPYAHHFNTDIAASNDDVYGLIA